MLQLNLGYILLLLISVSVDSIRRDSSWFDCGIQHACKIFDDPKNWHDAEAVCNAEFGHLTSIISINDDREPIASYASELNITDYWIGLNHLFGLQDHWRFTDGETVNSGLWAAGYPETKDLYGLIEMCGAEWVGGFYNEHCDKKNQYVCKKLRGAIIPTPPTTAKGPSEKFYCPIGYTAIDPRQEPNMGEKCFKFVFLDLTDGVDWYEAVRRCRVPGRKSDIASIHGPYEHEFVRSHIVNRTFHLWIGLQRTWGGKGWKWLDNSAFTSEDANWEDSEPSAMSEDCVEVLHMPSAGKWNNAYCHHKRFGYICQTFKDPDNPIMEPPPPPQQECLEGYTPYPYGCYRLLSTTKKSWAEMRDECRSHSRDTIKSDLVSIHSDAEDATLHISVMQIGVRAWIGLMENENDIFEWSNGWYPTYTNLRSTEADDEIHMGCVATDSSAGGGWYQVNCTTPLAAICKCTDDEPTKAPTVKNGSCPGEVNGITSWLKHESYCYLPVAQAKEWQDANRHCTKYGSSTTLVSIHSDDENAFVLANMPKLKDKAWIGLYMHNQDKRLSWTDGSPIYYLKWYMWAPHVNDRACGSMFTDGRYQSDWETDYCSDQYPFMCKVEQGPPIQPPPEHPKPCPDGWHKFGAFCYFPFPLMRMGWHHAEEHCQRKGGDRTHLPTITNKFQLEFLSDIMISAYTTHIGPYWIGLIKENGEPMFHWIGSGDEYDPRGFNLFENGLIQPNMKMEQCVAVVDKPSTNARQWDMISCDQPAAYVCELQLETTVVAYTEENSMDADTDGENLAIIVSIPVFFVGSVIIVIIVVILVRNGNTVGNGGTRTDERNRTTSVIPNEAALAPFSWESGQREIYLTPAEHSNKAEPVFHTETAGGTGQKHTYITLLEDGTRKLPMIPKEAYGTSFSRTTGTDECTVYTTQSSQLQDDNLPPEEHQYEILN